MSTDPAPRVNYRLVVRGELGDQFAALFEGMQIFRENGTTAFCGPVRDQTHLAGIIERTQDLGLEIISLSELKDDGLQL